MFEDMSIYRVIVVTGCQRSGTTLAAHAIAQDTGHTYVDEDEYGTDDYEAWRKVIARRDKIVVHSPAMARYVHDLVGWYGIFVVWMDRNIEDVKASERRIGWSTSKAVGKERDKYRDTQEYAGYLPICAIKRRYWARVQRPMLRGQYHELAYEALEQHSLWVPPNERTHFDKRQWRAENDSGGDAPNG